MMYSSDYTEFRLHEFEKWLKQNDGNIIDCFEGCLLDNYIVYCKNGIAIIFEEYVNSCSSCYKVYFFRHNKTDSEDYKRIENEWYKLSELEAAR